jgi:hypothetical protein
MTALLYRGIGHVRPPVRRELVVVGVTVAWVVGVGSAVFGRTCVCISARRFTLDRALVMRVGAVSLLAM